MNTGTTKKMFSFGFCGISKFPKLVKFQHAHMFWDSSIFPEVSRSLKYSCIASPPEVISLSSQNLRFPKLVAQAITNFCFFHIRFPTDRFRNFGTFLGSSCCPGHSQDSPQINATWRHHTNATLWYHVWVSAHAWTCNKQIANTRNYGHVSASGCNETCRYKPRHNHDNRNHFEFTYDNNIENDGGRNAYIEN